MDAPFAAIPDQPGASAARGITIAIPFTLVLWAFAAWLVTPIF